MDYLSLSSNLLTDYQAASQQQELQLYFSHTSVSSYAAEEETKMEEEVTSMDIEPQSPLVAIKMEEDEGDVFQPLQLPAAGVGGEKPTKKRSSKKAAVQRSFLISVQKCKVADCPHIFESKLELFLHLNEFHPELKISKVIHCCQHPNCLYASNRASSLKRHAFTHSDVRPYTCKGCGKQYKSSSGYRAHIKKYHPEELKQQKNQKGGNPAA